MTWIDPWYHSGDLDDIPSFLDIMKYILSSKWTDYFSESTLQVFGELVYDLAYEKLDDAETTLWGYFKSRSEHFVENPRPFEWAKNAFFFFCYYFLMMNGTTKFSVMQFEWFALPWSCVQAFFVWIQFCWLLFFNNWFSGGNFILLWMFGFTVLESISAGLLWFNMDWYDYTLFFRIYRYYALAAAVGFNCFYIGLIIDIMVMYGKYGGMEYDKKTH